MGKFDNKTLLVLGSNVGSVDIVKYARKEGAYTIVADYYPSEKSSAKMYAHENVLVSTADIQSLSELIEKRHVDGVLAGISEFNLISAMKLSEKHHLPFYCSKQQWDLIEHKDTFRKLCEQNNVPCPRTYYIGDRINDTYFESISTPVVVKPVDCSASTGVHICYSNDKIREAALDALALSSSGKYIIEQFVEGDEFTAHYTIANGESVLSCVDNRYPISVNEGNVTTIPGARIYPCLFLEDYIKQVNPAMLQLCNNLGLKNAILFIQGIYNRDKNCFYIFEAGLRCAGEAPYRFIERLNGNNALHLIVDNVLSATSTFDIKLEDPKLYGKCCGIVSFIATGGIVGNISGLEEAVATTSSVLDYEKRYDVGDKTPSGNTLRQLMIRFVMLCDTREKLLVCLFLIFNKMNVMAIGVKW